MGTITLSNQLARVLDSLAGDSDKDSEPTVITLAPLAPPYLTSCLDYKVI